MRSISSSWRALGLLQGGHPPLALLQVAAVVAGILGEGAVPDLDDAPHHLVEKEAVVGDQDHGAGIGGKVAFEPVAGGQVEMVGRFVEEQQVGALQQQPGQGDAHLPAAGEGLAGFLPVALGKTETAQHLGDFGLDLVAAPLAKGFLDVGIAVEVGLGVAFGDRRLELAQFLLHGQQFRQGAAHLGEKGLPAMFETVLGEIAEGGTPGHLHLAGIGRYLPGQHLEQGGLAGAVFSAQADLVAGAQVPVDAGEEPPAAKILDDLAQL